ncbi:MAG: OmpA family protein [Nitrosomonas sp.]|nr:OmpA family protein [Nitrosomonas sp.]
MPENLTDSVNSYETYPVKGEAIALWIPLSLALIGTIMIVIVTQSLLPQQEIKPPAINAFSSTDPTTVSTDRKNISAGIPTGHGKTEPKKTVDCPPLFFFTFSKDSATPKNHSLMPQITRLNNWLQQHPDKKVVIEGHTDSSGKEEYNLLLSYRRAKAAEKILIEAGISHNHLVTRALGEQEPLQDQPARSEKHRRASIRVDALEACINPLINEESN